MATVLTYDLLIERVHRWSISRNDIRLAMMIGSRARTERPADPYSDLDLIMVTTRPDVYISTVDWLSDLGTHHITFLEGTAVGSLVERRVLFDGGLDMDFVPIPLQTVRAGWPPEIAGVLARGYKVLVDKDNLTAQFPVLAAAPSTNRVPTQDEFHQLVSDFLYHAVWTAKKLCRGELWTAKMGCDGYLKRQLLQMIEWRQRVSKGTDFDTWHEGRFLDQWVAPDVLEELQFTFARYNRDEVWAALSATVDLFRRLGVEAAERLDYQYPAAGDAYVSQLLVKYRTQCAADG